MGYPELRLQSRHAGQNRSNAGCLFAEWDQRRAHLRLTELRGMILMLRSLFCILLLLSVSGSAAAADRNGDDDAQLDSATLDLIHEGVALRRAGKDEAALNVFLEAEKHAPNSVRVLLHVTAAGQATGKWLLAFQYLQKAS